jgi:DNA-directed RNA polymerase specialized sigma24 family protein
MKTKTTKIPWDYYERHYRAPARIDDPVQLLPHPKVARGICGALLANGFQPQDMEDGLHDVYVKALKAFRRAPPPPELGQVRALCRKIAREHAIDVLRRADKRRRDFAGPCADPDEHTPLEYGAERRDPVDAGRQLEVLAELFREGCMPEGGVDVLQGVASGATHREIAEDLGITEHLAKWRTRVMRKVFRMRMARLGMLPDILPLRVIVSIPSAVATLRQAA